MIDPEDFLLALEANGVQFVTGVPDSLLSDVCGAISTKLGAGRHVIAANEGAAVGLAIGHHLATGRAALVYLQNSGLGKCHQPARLAGGPGDLWRSDGADDRVAGRDAGRWHANGATSRST